MTQVTGVNQVFGCLLLEQTQRNIFEVAFVY